MLKVVVLLLVLAMILWPKNIFSPEKEVEISEKIVASTTPTIEPVLTATPEPTLVSSSTSKPTPTETPFEVLAPTVLMSTEELTYDDSYVGEEPAPPPKDTYKLIVNVYYQFITVYTKDETGEFTIPVRYMLCTTGKKSTPTPLGSFEMGTGRIRIIKSEASSSARYASQLTDDIYFHSLLYEEWNDTSTYTETSYKNLGTRASHGCIRLWVPDAKWIYFNIAAGTNVEVIEGEENEETARIRAQLVFPPYPENHN